MRRLAQGLNVRLTIARMSPTVEVVSHGPAGVLNYREGSNIHTFAWEFGAADVIMSVYVPAPADWDTAIPWAAGRRTEVLGYIGRKLAEQHPVKKRAGRG